MSPRRSLACLIAVLVGCGLLAVVGTDLEGRLEPTSLVVPGTGSAHGQALAERYFGASSPFAVLLQGPSAAIERQGPGLVRALRRDRQATVLSPWDRGSVAYLRPAPRKALILVDYHVPATTAMQETVPALERILRRIHPPVRAVQSGYASVSRALQRESLDATERAELIALPLLLVVLLVVFRSVLAAAIPLLFGALTVAAGRGGLVLLDSVMRIEALSVVVCTMMGLALGVDYSLLLVSRFREELARTGDRWAAARVARATAGRTTMLAGATLFTSIFLSSVLQPGSLLTSLAVALLVVVGISVAISVLALPPLLGVLGSRIDLGRIGAGRRRERRPRAAAVAAVALRRPALAAAVIGLALAALAVPALAFNTGAPGVAELSGSSPARRSAQQIDRALGPGWEAPFEIVVATRRGPVTSGRRLALLSRAQHRILAQPGIRAVIGPAAIGRATRPLRRFGKEIESGGAGGSALSELGPQIDRAGTAVSRLRRGLARGAAGSGLLARGANRAALGAGLLAEGVGRAATAGERAQGALGRLSAGTRRLSKAQREASVAGLSLALELRSFVPSLRRKALRRARGLAASLAQAAAGDPSLRGEAESARLLARVIAAERTKARQMRGEAIGLNGGLSRIVAGGKRLEGGVQALATASGRLEGGLRRLNGGARRLSRGLGALEGGAGALKRGLASGFHRSFPLQHGLARAGVEVAAAVRPFRRNLGRLRRSSPGLFDSGYFVLSALDGAPPRRRRLAGEAVNLERGGQAARMLIVGSAPFNTAGSRRTSAMLAADARRLGREGGLVAGLAGGAAILNDYGSATRSRLPLVIGAIVAITVLMLVAILRAPLLALLAVLLNLVSVAAAIGVVSLVCKLPAGFPLGGHSYIDTIGAAAIFGVTFGLSIDYAVFFLLRMREHYDRHGDNRAAIDYGLDRTGRVITGAALIMAAVFASFAAAPIATVSQMGVGLTVAILLDATVVRLILLPSLMTLIGDRIWRPLRFVR